MFSTAILCLTSAFYLRMFARKSSNIDLFFNRTFAAARLRVTFVRNAKKLGVTDFVSEIRYLKGQPNFDMNFDLPPMSVCLKISQMNL